MASTKKNSSGAQTGSDSFNTVQSTTPPLLAQPAASVVVDESSLAAVVAGPYMLIEPQPGPDGLSWTSKITHPDQKSFVIEAKSCISLSSSPFEWQRVICVTYDSHRRHYELVVACGTNYKCHPITAVRFIKTEADFPLSGEEMETYKSAWHHWMNDIVAKIDAERKVREKTISPVAVLQETSPATSTAAPTELLVREARKRLPRQSKDKQATKRYLFVCTFLFATYMYS